MIQEVDLEVALVEDFQAVEADLLVEVVPEVDGRFHITVII